MLKIIDHIGIAVEDLAQGLALYRDILGMEFLGIEEIEDQKLKVAMLKIGEVGIELLEPTAEDSPVAKFMAKGGRGFHHIAYRVDDVDAALKRCEEKGYVLIDRKSRPGAGGARIGFLHPRSTGGVLTELTSGPTREHKQQNT